MSLTQCLSLIAGATLAGTAVADSAITADEARAIVAEMLADAETRSSLQSSGGTAGHDGKFFMSSAGGSFRLNVGGQIQFRYMLNLGDDLGGTTDNDDERGFQTRRTKLDFTGTVYDDIDFKITGAFDRDGGAFTLEDAYTVFNMNENSAFQVGQFKLPFAQEELVSSRRQLAADRSVANEIFNQGRSQGVMYRYSSDDWRFAAAFSDGFNTVNTDYNTSNGTGLLGAGEADWAFTGRFEYKGAGNWNQFRDFTSEAGSETAWMIGAAAHWETGEVGGAGSTDYDSLAYTVDATLEGDGWSLFGAFIGRSQDVDGGIDADDFGHVLQAAFRIPESKWEIFGRWDGVYADSSYTNNDDFNTLTFGANYYMHGHAAKFTVDLQYFLDDSADNDIVSANSGIGLLTDSDDGEIGIRAQFQLLF
ncbi:MAG: porin [Phycisphaerales bacterium]